MIRMADSPEVIHTRQENRLISGKNLENQSFLLVEEYLS